MLVYLVVVAQLLYGCWVVQPVESQTRVIERHNLPQNRLQIVFGSQENGSCSSIYKSTAGNINCNGTSVLNDGRTPTLHEVSSNPASSWATELFTLNVTQTPTILSFQVDNEKHDRVKLAVFNCPEMGISLPFFYIFFDNAFRSDKFAVDPPLGALNRESQLMGTSCDHLLVFCVQYNSRELVPITRYINLVFLRPNNSNSTYGFLGEVTFLNDSGKDCDFTMPITGPIVTTTTTHTTTQGTDDSRTSTPPNPNINQTGSPTNTAIIVALVVVAVLLIAVVIAVVVLAVRFRKHKYEVRQLLNIVMETKEDEKEAESCMNDHYNVNDKPPQNGVKTATESVTISDSLYSNPDEIITNDTYSVIRDSQKKMNHDQNDPVIQNSEHSPTPQKPTVKEIMYAVPDKEKTSNKAPAIPEKSSELVEYLDTKEAGAVTSSDADLPEYCEIGTGNRLNSSTGPVPLSSPAYVSNLDSNPILSNLDSNPIYQPTDIVPTQATTVTASHLHDGVPDTDTSYKEPLPLNEQEPEWDPDQNIYEAIYTEPLKPSLFMQEREEVDTNELRPYTSIYTAPIIPTTKKPLSVSYANIKEIRSLGNGNFGEVVLAQTFGLTPRQLQLKDRAQYTLVAVKKLKENASERNKQRFEKEVKFMSRLDHPNVIRLLGVCLDKAAPFIMMEYMSNGDLNQYLKGYSNVKPVEASALIYMSTQIASAMQYLASQNFVHRDLATRNCLIGSRDTIKVSDFGMSRSLYESQYYIVSGHAILPICWMATECFYGKFSAKTDVWAFGVTMWEIFMLCSEQPYYQFQDRDVVEDAIKGPDRTLLERPRKCPEDVYYNIMRKCWIYNASQRPTFDKLYELLSYMNQ